MFFKFITHLNIYYKAMKPVDYGRVKNVDDLGYDDILDIISMI